MDVVIQVIWRLSQDDKNCQVSSLVSRSLCVSALASGRFWSTRQPRHAACRQSVSQSSFSSLASGPSQLSERTQWTKRPARAVVSTAQTHAPAQRFTHPSTHSSSRMAPHRQTEASHPLCVERPVVSGGDLTALLLARDSIDGIASVAELPPWQQQQVLSPSPKHMHSQPQQQQRTPRASVHDLAAVETLANAWTAHSPTVCSSDTSSSSSSSATPPDSSSLSRTRNTPGNERSADVQQTHADSTRKRRQKTLSTAERRRLEILALREEAGELERTLVLLRGDNGRGRGCDRSSDCRLVAASPATDVSEASVWRLFADDAHERLAQSLHTNDRLKAHVLEQKQHAKSLRRVLRKRAAQIAVRLAVLRMLLLVS